MLFRAPLEVPFFASEQEASEWRKASESAKASEREKRGVFIYNKFMGIH